MQNIPLDAHLPTSPSPRWKYKQEDFECAMRCMRCTARVGNRRCARKSCYTIPYCWQHLKSVAHLRVGRTTLKDPATGRRFPFRGLFACKASDPGGLVFRTNQRITPYVGEVLSEPELDARYGDGLAPYTERVGVGMQGDPDVYVDGACLRGVASLANDAIADSTCTTGKCETNAFFFSGDGNYPSLRASKYIYDGDEIFVSYGDEYWDGDIPEHVTSPRSVYEKLEYKC
jgi:hypothetical protein